MALLLVILYSIAIIEGVMYRFIFHKKYDFKSAVASYVIFAVKLLVGLIPIVFSAPIGIWLKEKSPIDLSELGWMSYVVLFIGVEFAYYWRHRLSHQTRWFWLGHYVHHSPDHINLSVNFRVGFTEVILGAYLFYFPLMGLLGFEPKEILAYVGFMVPFTYIIHAEWVPKLGWLEGIVNTPSAHRVHHARNAEYMDRCYGSNFGFTSVIFDRIFGTYKPERDDVKIDYGTLTPCNTNNPVLIIVKPFFELYADIRKAKSIPKIFKLLFNVEYNLDKNLALQKEPINKTQYEPHESTKKQTC